MPDASPVTGVMSPRRMPGKIVEGHRSRVDRIVNTIKADARLRS